MLFAPELEKKEYRGIAFYTKSLIKALYDSGADIWLVSSINPDNLKIHKFNENSRNYIFNYEILQNFYNGNDLNIELKNFSQKYLFLNFIPGFKRNNKFIFFFLTAVKTFFQSNKYDKNNTKKINFNYKYDNPYLKFEKLSFMHNISGFITAPNISSNFNYKSFFPFKNKIIFELDFFDCYITSEPLNLFAKNNIPIFQTIHDLIPLEFNTNILSIKSFYRKIKISGENEKIFISDVTKDKFTHLIGNKIRKGKTSRNESIIIQPPSLEFESQNFLKSYKNILYSISTKIDSKKINKNKKSKTNYNLQPFNYFLFNASIDSSKNVLLLVDSFINSQAQKNGIKLVLVGQLKNDEYSKKIKRMISINSGIISTGYVNKAIKSALYLNALSLLSPSMIEGFGIPVLDACCLGLNCFASDCASHREIQNLYDFKNLLVLYPPTSLTKWSEIFSKEEF